MEKETEVISKYKKFFNSESGWESNLLAIVVLAWLTPILLTYFIIKFGILLPIGRLLGGKKK